MNFCAYDTVILIATYDDKIPERYLYQEARITDILRNGRYRQLLKIQFEDGEEYQVDSIQVEHR